ncbi:hypothetical protein [Halorussus salinus]|uniref:hypothetical protein n=1 Tax=Halorussus salinus TaxID=1364935 RepID=UPI00109252D7|nr:hypothetical protein [Halorussus salinus]
MEPDELVERVATDLELYVMSGELRSDAVGEALADAAFGERAVGFEDLLVLHYLLESETVAFADALRRRVRELRTGTATESTVTRSEVSSRIDWSETMRERYARNPDDSTLFVTQSRYEEYDLDENLLLRALLDRFEAGLDTWADELAAYDWGDAWSDGLLDRTRRTIASNVVLNRIRDPEPGEPTPAMVEAARRSRHALYREAAERYRRYEAVCSSDPDRDELRDLLANTLVVPTGSGRSAERTYSTLFELYVLFAVVEELSAVVGASGDLAPIRRGRDEVARFELADGDRLLVFYEQAAGSKDFSFLGSTADAAAGSVTRREETRERTRRIRGELFDTDSRVATKRPDVLVVYEESGRVVPDRSFVVEVKYHGDGESGAATVERGVEELLEYLAYMRHDGRLVFDGGPDDWYGADNGLLVVDDDDSLATPIDADSPVRVAQAGDLGAVLRQQLADLYGDLARPSREESSRGGSSRTDET